MKKVDMSETAILRRLKTVDQLRELCLSLMKAKKIHDEKAAKHQSAQAKSATETTTEIDKLTEN